MSDLVDQNKTILGFRLGFPSWVNLNLNKAKLELNFSEELDVRIQLLEQLEPRTHNIISNVSITVGHC